MPEETIVSLQPSGQSSKQSRSKQNLPATGFRFLLVALLVLGIFFRFYNIDRKVYWHDEIYTSLRIFGYTYKEFIQQVFDGRIVSREDLQKYQSPNLEKSLADTIQSLVTEDPHHPPLYYVITRWWTQIFGYSVAAIRSVSALISLLVFPCTYWLCWELFGTTLVGWVAIALIAVSPFHLLYAQEAREYSLWTVTTLLSSAALLQALRRQTKISWGIYTVSLALGLYTFPFTALTGISHGLYVIANERWRWTKSVNAYFLASVASILAFTPWIWVTIKHFKQAQDTTKWLSERISYLQLIKMWITNVIRLFFDINQSVQALLKLASIPYLILCILVGYSFYFLFYTTKRRVWFFIFSLIVIPALTLILPDLIIGGQRSATSRYLIPCYLGIELAVAYLLTTHIFGLTSLHKKLWRFITAILITTGVVSCVVISQADTWWMKQTSYNIPQVARLIDRAPRPLLISSKYRTNAGEILSLSYLLEPKVRFQLVIEPNIPRIPDGFTDIFIFNPSEEFRTEIEAEAHSKLELVSKSNRIWRIKK